MTFICPHCRVGFNSYFGLRLHVQKSHPLSQFCPVCNRKCKDVVRHLSSMAQVCEQHARFYLVHGAFANRKARKRRDEMLELLQS